MEIKEIVGMLIEIIKNDKSYRYGWQSNIAMAFQDEYSDFVVKNGRNAAYQGINHIANAAADKFLNFLCSDVQVNSEELNIYISEDAFGVTGEVLGGCYYDDKVDSNYTGHYVVLNLMKVGYVDVGLGDSLFLYQDAKWLRIFKKDGNKIYAYPMDISYHIRASAKNQIAIDRTSRGLTMKDRLNQVPNPERSVAENVK